MKFSSKPIWMVGVSAVLASSLLVGCSSKKKTTAVSETAVEAPDKPSIREQIDTTLTARVQAISRKNRILTLKFPDDKVAKVKIGPEVKNFAEIGVGDTIKAQFRDMVEVFVVGPGGKPAWDEIDEIKPVKGAKPGAAIIRAYELSATVTAIDYPTRKVTLKGPNGKTLQVTAKPEIRRFNEIKVGDLVTARLVEAIDIEVLPPERADSSSRTRRR